MSNTPAAPAQQRPADERSHNGNAPNGNAPDGNTPTGNSQGAAAPQSGGAPQDQGPRQLDDVLADLAKPIPQRHLRTKRQGGATITFCSWYRTQRILDHYTRGYWEKKVTDVSTSEERIFVTCSITIHGQKGSLTREATGTELLSTDAYGDPSSNAEAQAFKRTCAQFGLGLHLYEKEE